MRQETAEAKQNLKYSEQNCFAAQAELTECKEVIIRNAVVFNVLNQEIENLQRENMRLNFMHGNIIKQLFAYKGVYLQVIEANSKLSKQLEEEKAANDIRYI